VVKVKIKMGLNEFDIELTLINRDLMGFKMLIGRDALNNKFVINPSKSFLLRQ
jgi:ribosomal protein S6--L-glutamate ligase